MSGVVRVFVRRGRGQVLLGNAFKSPNPTSLVFCAEMDSLYVVASQVHCVCACVQVRVGYPDKPGVDARARDGCGCSNPGLRG
jgi:hypothetical protein